MLRYSELQPLLLWLRRSYVCPQTRVSPANSGYGTDHLTKSLRKDCRGSSAWPALLSNAATTPPTDDVTADFNAADTDHNGAMSLQEYLTYMNADGAPDAWATYYKK